MERRYVRWLFILLLLFSITIEARVLHLTEPVTKDSAISAVAVSKRIHNWKVPPCPKSKRCQKAVHTHHELVDGKLYRYINSYDRRYAKNKTWGELVGRTKGYNVVSVYPIASNGRTYGFLPVSAYRSEVPKPNTPPIAESSGDAEYYANVEKAKAKERLDRFLSGKGIDFSDPDAFPPPIPRVSVTHQEVRKREIEIRAQRNLENNKKFGELTIVTGYIFFGVIGFLVIAGAIQFTVALLQEFWISLQNARAARATLLIQPTQPKETSMRKIYLAIVVLIIITALGNITPIATVTKNILYALTQGVSLVEVSVEKDFGEENFEERVQEEVQKRVAIEDTVD